MNDEETIELAQELVRIDSVNPSLVPGASGEAELAAFVLDFLKKRGIGATLEEALPGRPNVIAHVGGGRAGPTLLLCCHMDTVSVEGMEDPFSGKVEGGRLYGRGAHDVKGGLAAMLAAVVALSRCGPLELDIIAAAVVDEEAYSAGTSALLSSGVRPDAAIVFEPTELDVAVAHKGFAWLSIETRGRAAHGSRPDEGIDAIAHMGRVLNAIEARDALLRSSDRHPLLGSGSAHASLIQGGRELSSYPDHCRLEIERRTLPGESEASIRAEMTEVVMALRGEDPRFEATFDMNLFRPAFEISPEHSLPRALQEATQAVTGRQCEFVGMTGWTDSALLAESGIPAVVFGPGGAGLHGLLEYGDLQQICRARDALIKLAELKLVR